jgi:hypothetical protein
VTGDINMPAMLESPLAPVIVSWPDTLTVLCIDGSMLIGAGTSTAMSCGYMPVPAPAKRYSQDAVITVTRTRVTTSRSRRSTSSSTLGGFTGQRFALVRKSVMLPGFQTTADSCAKPCCEPRSFADQPILIVVVNTKMGP